MSRWFKKIRIKRLKVYLAGVEAKIAVIEEICDQKSPWALVLALIAAREYKAELLEKIEQLQA